MAASNRLQRLLPEQSSRPQPFRHHTHTNHAQIAELIPEHCERSCRLGPRPSSNRTPLSDHQWQPCRDDSVMTHLSVSESAALLASTLPVTSCTTAISTPDTSYNNTCCKEGWVGRMAPLSCHLAYSSADSGGTTRKVETTAARVHRTNMLLTNSIHDGSLHFIGCRTNSTWRRGQYASWQNRLAWQVSTAQAHLQPLAGAAAKSGPAWPLSAAPGDCCQRTAAPPHQRPR